MDKLTRVEKKLNTVEKKFEESTLALEMLKELKKQGQHKFIIIIVLIIALIGTNVGWLIYESQFETVTEEETTTQTIEDIDTSDSSFTQIIK